MDILLAEGKQWNARCGKVLCLRKSKHVGLPLVASARRQASKSVSQLPDGWLRQQVIGPLLDGRDAAALKAFRITPPDLADPSWRTRMLSGAAVPTQQMADAAIKEGHAGIVVPSYARGAPANALNLVLWDWEGRIALVEHDDRLGLQKSLRAGPACIAV